MISRYNTKKSFSTQIVNRTPKSKRARLPGVAIVLKDFKLTTIFPTFVRGLISDFAVLLSIILFVVIDIVCGLPTPKLTVPDKFQVCGYT